MVSVKSPREKLRVGLTPPPPDGPSQVDRPFSISHDSLHLWHRERRLRGLESPVRRWLERSIDDEGIESGGKVEGEHREVETEEEDRTTLIAAEEKDTEDDRK